MKGVNQTPNPEPHNENEDSRMTGIDIGEMTPSQRAKWLQSQAVVAYASAIRQQVPELPSYLVLTHTVNTMVTKGMITPEVYLQWTAGLMQAAHRPMFYSN